MSLSARQRIVLAGAGAVVVLLLLATALRSTGTADAPTHEVRRESFRQEVTAEGVLEAVRTTPLSAPPRTRGPAKIAWMAEDGVFVGQGDVVVRFDPMERERELFEGEVALVAAESRIRQTEARSENTLVDVERDRALAEVELSAARSFSSKDPEIFSRVEIIEAQIDEDLASLKLEHAEGRGAIQESLSAFELEMFEIERGQAEVKIAQANQALNALEVRAPHDGIVIFVRDWRGNTRQVGDTVYSGQAIAELPALDVMKADIHVLEADAGGLSEGRPATLTVEAAPGRSFEATIRHVDRMPKPKVRDVPVQYFSVTLGLTETEPGIMKPGQRVRATLNLIERDDVLVVPRQAVFERSGRKTVFRAGASGFEEVEVRLGPASLGRVVIEDGLSAGDRVALRNPEESYRALVPASSSDSTEVGSP
ncbi:MAG: efflux RND transporter periplasmic adaptor subunit [Myxococcota bacterium]